MQPANSRSIALVERVGFDAGRLFAALRQDRRPLARSRALRDARRRLETAPRRVARASRIGSHSRLTRRGGGGRRDRARFARRRIGRADRHACRVHDAADRAGRAARRRPPRDRPVCGARGVRATGCRRPSRLSLRSSVPPSTSTSVTAKTAPCCRRSSASRRRRQRHLPRRWRRRAIASTGRRARRRDHRLPHPAAAAQQDDGAPRRRRQTFTAPRSCTCGRARPVRARAARRPSARRIGRHELAARHGSP